MLLLGGSGRLGRALLAQGSVQWACAAPPRAQLDLASASLARLEDEITGRDPAVVINVSAMSEVDRCTAEFEQASAINGLAPGLLAQACAARGVRVCAVSCSDRNEPARLGSSGRAVNFSRLGSGSAHWRLGSARLGSLNISVRLGSAR